MEIDWEAECKKACDYSETVPGSFTPTSARHLFEAALTATHIVEVGVDQGKSASVLLHVACLTGAAVTLVDLWPGIMVENRDKVIARIKRDFPGLTVTVIHRSSQDAIDLVEDFDFVHIDANHTAPEGINIDCALWLPKLNVGGVACFHDFSPDNSFPDVWRCVNEACAGWEDLGEWDSLGIRRKPL